MTTANSKAVEEAQIRKLIDGWVGGLGTSGYSDPKEEMVGIVMTQRLMDSPVPARVFLDFWTSAYQAIDD
jgi:hypothetical protein